jgi:hypothetical protein
MAELEANDHQRRRWMRPNAHHYIRHDAWRFMPPGSPIHTGPDVVKYFWPEQQAAKSRESYPQASGGLAEALERERKELLRLKSELMALRADIKLRKFLQAFKAYNPNQPRVLAGNPDGGQWTSDGAGGATRVRLAQGDKPRLGPHAMAAIAAEVAKRAIEAYRKGNGLWDLFGSRIGTVSYTEFNGEKIFGSNSTSATYMRRDRNEAISLRNTLLEKYPEVMNTSEIGRRPNDALFHAETTVLLRAVRANGGTLAGKTLEVHTDRILCRSCETLLPYVGRELGNPTVTFIDRIGRKRTMRNGAWTD